MPAKSINVNCKLFDDGRCSHHAAPKPWVGSALCVHIMDNRDPRSPEGCRLQVEHEMLDPGKLVAPPKVSASEPDQSVDDQYA